MRMSEIMSSFGLWVYPTIGMIIFLVVFVIAVSRVVGRSRKPEYDRGGCLPLANDSFEPITSPSAASESRR